MTTIISEVENLGIHGVLSGLASAGLSLGFITSEPVNIGGVGVPFPLIIGAMGTTSAIVQKAVRDEVIPMIVEEPSINTILYLLEPAIQGTAFVGIDFLIHMFMSTDSYTFEDASNAFIVGSLSSVIANFASTPVEKYVENML